MAWSVYEDDEYWRARGFSVENYTMNASPSTPTYIGKISGDVHLNLTSDINSTSEAYFEIQEDVSITFTLTSDDYYLDIRKVNPDDLDNKYNGRMYYWNNYGDYGSRNVVTQIVTIDLLKGYYSIGAGNDGVVEYVSATIDFADPILFTDEPDWVDFNMLTASQSSVIVQKADFYNAKQGDDFVSLPNENSIVGSVVWDSKKTFNAGEGNDYIVGSILADNVDGGEGDDTFVLKNIMKDYVIGGEKVSKYGDLYIKGKDGKVDVVKNVEFLEFADRTIEITKWSELVKISSLKGLNVGTDGKALVAPKQDFMIKLLGPPADNLTSSPDTKLKDGMSEYAYSILDDVTIDGRKFWGAAPLIESLQKILKVAGTAKLPGVDSVLLKSISSEGMAVPRLQENSTKYSNHTWGTAIDLKIDGILDHAPDGSMQKGLAKLVELFNKAGWVSGAKYHPEDSMHFEASVALLEKIFPVKNGGAGGDRMVGSANYDFLIGNAGNDALFGKDGADRLSGGAGTDKLTGGNGKDFFIFDAKLGSNNLDRINDFSVKDDSLWLDRDVFAKAGKVGDLSAGAYYMGASAHDATDRILYDSKAGKLLYDVDGTGKAASIQFALIDTGLKLTASDFDLIA